MPPVVFLFQRPLHRFRHLAEALPVDEIQTAGLRRVAHVHLRPLGPACQTADAQVLGPDSAPESPLLHLGQHSGPPLIVVLAADHVRQKTSRLRTPTLACLARLRFAQLPRLVLASARPVCRALCRVVYAQPVIGLTRVPVLHPAPRDRLCHHVDLAYPPDHAPLPLDLFPDLVPGFPLLARRHELVAEHFLDFQL